MFACWFIAASAVAAFVLLCCAVFCQNMPNRGIRQSSKSALSKKFFDGYKKLLFRYLFGGLGACFREMDPPI